jgi:hypothetical protein
MYSFTPLAAFGFAACALELFVLALEDVMALCAGAQSPKSIFTVLQICGFGGSVALRIASVLSISKTSVLSTCNSMLVLITALSSFFTFSFFAFIFYRACDRYRIIGSTAVASLPSAV